MSAPADLGEASKRHVFKRGQGSELILTVAPFLSVVFILLSTVSQGSVQFLVRVQILPRACGEVAHCGCPRNSQRRPGGVPYDGFAMYFGQAV